MTYAIKRNNGDVLYFDAITSATETYTSQITKHPLASGAFISDHTIKDNKKFSLRAVLSDADFNLNRPTDYYTNLNTVGLVQGQVSYPTGQSKQFVNDTQTTVPVSISNTAAKWRSFLPEVVSQFTASTIPTVTVTEQTKVKTAAAVRLDLIAMHEKSESFTLMEFNDNTMSRHWENIIMIGLSFAEDAESGLGLFPTIDMEQATYTNVQNVKVKITPNKGRKTGEVTKTNTKPGDDAEVEPTEAANKSAGIYLMRAASK